MKYYLGIDGGGTRTTAAVTDEKGEVILKKSGKTINFYSVGMSAANENLKNLMNEIYEQIGKVKFSGAFIGCSALDGECEKHLADELCKNAVDADGITVHSDVFVALKSLDVPVCPALVICGTGSMAIAQNENGEEIIAGGWGHILGDEGSAYSIALIALKECTKMCDKDENTALIKSANEYFRTNNFREIINIIYSAETSKDVIAGFAANVGKLCEKGDEICKKIISSEAQKIAETVTVLLKKLKRCSALGLYGGVFQHNEIFREIFSNEIKKFYPDIEIRLLTCPPEEGAARLAREKYA